MITMTLSELRHDAINKLADYLTSESFLDGERAWSAVASYQDALEPRRLTSKVKLFDDLVDAAQFTKDQELALAS